MEDEAKKKADKEAAAQAALLEKKEAERLAEETAQQNETLEEIKELDPETKVKINIDGEDQIVKVKDLPTYVKKSRDFDGIIEKQRIQKLKAQPKPENDNNQTTGMTKEDVQEIASRAALNALQQNNLKVYEDNLAAANKQFLAEHPWANDEAVFTQISQSFKPGEALSVEQILSKLKIAAHNTYPEKYMEALENKARVKVMAEKETIDSGSAGGGTSIPRNKESVVITKEDQDMADKFFGGDVQRWLKNKPKK